VLELLEHLIGGEDEDGVAVAAREPAERVSEEGFPTPTRPTMATWAWAWRKRSETSSVQSPGAEVAADVFRR
jgi:hypothetical protein